MTHLFNIDLIILFFFLGALSAWIKSDLEIPGSISKFLSIFLLLSLGLKGGHEVLIAENLSGFFPVLLVGLLSCLMIPMYLFHWLKGRLGAANAAALAASYGSVSAVTLIAAQGVLTNEGIPFDGYMVAVMALMEIPAIPLSFHLYRKATQAKIAENSSSIFSAKSVVLLLGGFIIGFLMNDPSWNSIAPVVKDSFKGVLAFFLLDLGIEAQRQLRKAWQFRWRALLIGCCLPLLTGSLIVFLSALSEIEQGNQVLLAVLAGSASYIAAPAAIRTAIPEANPSLYVALPLALTFPMNVIFGIPFYIELSRFLDSILI